MDLRDLRPLYGTAFAAAAVAHLWGNHHTLTPTLAYQGPLRFGTSVLLAAAIGLAVARPRQLWSLDVLAAAFLLKMGADLPFAPNHQLIIGLLGLAWLLARAVGRFQPTTPAEPFLAIARWTFLTAYGFAAFAKLNTGFLDVASSCATLLGTSLASSWGLEAPGSGLARGLIALTLAVELSVPPLLLWQRTRTAGIVLAAVFHGALVFDPAFTFYDFTVVVLLGLTPFLPDGSFQHVARRAATSSATSAAWATAGIAIALVTVLLPRTEQPLLTAWLAGVLLSLALVVVVLGLLSVGRSRLEPVEPRRSLALAPALALVLLTPVLLSVVNGMTPYLEVKNLNSWNMYSNLRTGDGTSNHVIVRASLPLSSTLADRVFVPGDDAGIETPRRAVYAALLAEGDGATRTVLDDGIARTITREQAAAAMSPVAFRLQRLGSFPPSGAQPCFMNQRG